MTDLPLDETALQAAYDAYVEMWERPKIRISAQNLLGHAISTYLREAKFRKEYRSEWVGGKPLQRQVGPWEPIPVVQAESEGER